MSVIQEFSKLQIQILLITAMGRDTTSYGQNQIVMVFTSLSEPNLLDFPDLSDSLKQASPVGVQPGDVVNYTLEVHNTGKTTDFVLTDTLPISTTLIPNSYWNDTGLITTSASQITWTAVSTAGTIIRAGFAATVTENSGTIILGNPYVLINTAGLSYDTDQYTELAATVIVNPISVYLPLVLRQ